MKVKLLDSTKLSNVIIGARTCWDSFHKGGLYDSPTNNISEQDFALLDRLINKHKHESISEHIVFVFSIKGISRACLQELARHRIASYSVKSTRYTLKELKNEEIFTNIPEDVARATKFVVFTENKDVDRMILASLEQLRYTLSLGISNDIVKYCLPESYKTDLVSTFNFRSFKNFYTLRNSKDALWEIQQLSGKMFEVLPKQVRELITNEK